MKRILVASLAAVAAVACSPAPRQTERPEVSGPARIEMDAVADHEESFGSSVPVRPAGSQEEQAAAGYISGTLQRNGYVARLESVPVGDLVRSTNIIGVPAGVDEPKALVVVPYDTPPEGPSNGLLLGIFLELARALNVESPDHQVFFVAVGADHATGSGGSLGSRRLARFMLDQGWDPLVIQMVDLVPGESVSITGDRAYDVIDMMTASTGPFSGFDNDDISIDPDVFAAAGFKRLLLSGDAEKIGEILLDFLRHYGV